MSILPLVHLRLVVDRVEKVELLDIHCDVHAAVGSQPQAELKAVG